ncbi:hypothetical protein BHM03_00007467 [Ensete ventricosum]|nr:hypothetical protein BHM03_00007467 [Ensete ventricosum]
MGTEDVGFIAVHVRGEKPRVVPHPQPSPFAETWQLKLDEASGLSAPSHPGGRIQYAASANALGLWKVWMDTCIHCAKKADAGRCLHELEMGIYTHHKQSQLHPCPTTLIPCFQLVLSTGHTGLRLPSLPTESALVRNALDKCKTTE